MEKQLLDLATWNRRDHFQFFNKFEEPFFGICTEVDVTKAYRMAKDLGKSFFLYYLYQSLVAANQVPAFRYRIEGEQVFIYDKINGSATINRPNGTFGFSYMEYFDTFGEFEQNASLEIARVQGSEGLELTSSNDNTIHYSSIPWIRFTSLSHARAYSFKDCIPKISFGKMYNTRWKKLMPVSIHAHHALMDGYDVGLMLDRFQVLLDGE